MQTFRTTAASQFDSHLPVLDRTTRHKYVTENSRSVAGLQLSMSIRLCSTYLQWTSDFNEREFIACSSKQALQFNFESWVSRSWKNPINQFWSCVRYLLYGWAHTVWRLKWRIRHWQASVYLYPVFADLQQTLEATFQGLICFHNSRWFSYHLSISYCFCRCYYYSL